MKPLRLLVVRARRPLFAALVLPWLFCPPWFVHAAEESVGPNILWLIAESFGPHLGCYGTHPLSDGV